MKSQIGSSQQLALVACPTYNKENKKLVDLMKIHSDLTTKMISVADEKNSSQCIKHENVEDSEDLTEPQSISHQKITKR